MSFDTVCPNEMACINFGGRCSNNNVYFARYSSDCDPTAYFMTNEDR